MAGNENSTHCALFCAGIWPFVALPLLLLIPVLFFTWQPIEQRVQTNADQQLKTDHAWASADAFNRGREILLQGIAPNKAAVDAAILAAKSATGVRSVRFVGDVRPPVIVLTAPTVTVTRNGQAITLSGTVDSQKTIAILVAQATQVFGEGGFTNQLTVAPNIAPDINIEPILVAASMVEKNARMEIRNQRLVLTGVVTSSEAKALVANQAARVFNGEIENQIEIVAPPCQLALNKALANTKINFAVGKATISPQSSALLENIAAIVQECPAAEFEVSGHTDATGNAEANKILSQQRADAVVARLDELGISAQRFTSRGFGAAQPLADNTSSQGRAANRRIEFRVTN